VLVLVGHVTLPAPHAPIYVLRFLSCFLSHSLLASHLHALLPTISYKQIRCRRVVACATKITYDIEGFAYVYNEIRLAANSAS
jgi:hypothetical protein